MEPLIRTEKVSVTYNAGKSNEFQSLKDVSVGIYPEEFTIIFGPSGCGKSTLLYSISALQRPTTGEVFVGNAAVSKMNSRDQALLRQTAIGMIFQSFYLIPSLNVLDNVCLPRVFRSEKKQERMDAGIRLLRRFGIVEQADKYPSQLSGGQKQRVAIARSLINDPSIILADEPVGNLDSKSAENVLTILQELRDVDKKAVVLVTHDPSHLSLANRILFMKDGAVVEERVQKETGSIQKKEESRKELENGSVVSKELNTLLRSFSGMPKEQSRLLLNPFKAEKMIDHIILALSEEQISLAKKYASELFFGEVDFQRFESSLDKDMENGGAGWDKRRAAATRIRVEEILKVAATVKNKENSAEAILEYLNEFFSLDERDPSWNKEALFLLLQKRLSLDIGLFEMKEMLNLPVKKNGLGFHRSLADKMAREIEVIMLVAY